MNPSASSIAHTDLMNLPIRRYEGPIHLVETADALAHALPALRQEPVLGFDTESRPSFRKGHVFRPSLVQFATARAVYLLRLRQVDCAAALAELLENRHLVKTGIALADDLRQLKHLFPFTEQNVVDLGSMAQRHGMKQTGLRNLVALFLGFRITKGPQTSNWEARTLSPAQVHYAATDAWACRELYRVFEKRGWLTTDGSTAPSTKPVAVPPRAPTSPAPAADEVRR